MFLLRYPVSVVQSVCGTGFAPGAAPLGRKVRELLREWRSQISNGKVEVRLRRWGAR